MNSNIKIHIIHYKKLLERKINLERYFKLNNYQREYFDKIDRNNLNSNQISKFKKDNINIAIFLSHIEAYKSIIKNNFKFSLILEDDSIPEDRFTKFVYKYLNDLPNDYDLFFVSSGKNNFQIPWYMRIPFRKVYKKLNIQTSWGGHGASRNADAYFISKKCCEILVNEFNSGEIIDLPIDWWLNKIIEKFDLDVYWAQPTIVTTNLYETSFNAD